MSVTQNEGSAPQGMPSLQQGLDQAGSPVKLLWRPNAEAPAVPVVPAEFVGWAEEQQAATKTVTLSEQSHHMRDLFIEGPDATRLLSECSVNNYEKFAVDQAKQFVAVNEQGQYVSDSILLRTAENAYTLTGIPSSMSWVLYHAEKGSYDVSFVDDPTSGFRGEGKPPVQFRYEIQGPRAMDLVAGVFGGPLPETKFFHSTPATLDGRQVRALRHAMNGQPGYEFIGDWADAEYVKDALLKAGQEFGLVQVGGLAYYNNNIESGWLATAAPAIYSDPQLRAYREWLGLFTYEGQLGIHGSRFSEDIEDYYASPYELGYGKVINLDHDFPGRDALVKAKDEVRRRKVTLVVNRDDVHQHFGGDPGYYSNFGQFQIVSDGRLVGQTFQGANIPAVGTLLFLSLVDEAAAAPGTEVTVVYGEDPGFGQDPAAVAAFPHLRATVQPSPYSEFARTTYRRN